MIELERCIFLRELRIVAPQEVVVIWPKEERQREAHRALLHRHREGRRHSTGANVATALSFSLDRKLVILEARDLIDQDGAKILILKRDPLECLLEIFALLLSRLKAVNITLGEVIVDPAVLSLELPRLLLLRDALCPLDVLDGHVHG